MTFGNSKSIIIISEISEVIKMTPKKKMGRPKSKDPLKIDVKVRLSEQMAEKLETYCKENKTEKATVIRELITDFLKDK